MGNSGCGASCRICRGDVTILQPCPGVLDEVLNVMDSHKTHGGVQNVALFLLRTILKDWALGALRVSTLRSD